MALTRAQLISGNIAEGAILAGQPQGVRPGGAGITIGTDGIISVDSQSIVGVMKLGQTAGSADAAYNGYTWPTTAGSAGQQLETDGAGLLSWADADGIDWTQKGQLIVGTGVSSDTLLNVGTNTAFLVADSSATAGLAYTSSLKSAVLLPVGNNTTERPLTPAVGQVRYNNTTNEFEGYSGATPIWQPLGGQPTGGGSDKIFFTNSQVVTTDYTISAVQNAVSAGSLTINAGVTVTIPAGAAWSIV